MRGNKTVTEEGVRAVVQAGDEVMKAASDVDDAVIATHQAWRELVPHHLDGVYNEVVDDMVHPALAEYIRYLRVHGAPSRVAPSSESVGCKPHDTDINHQQEGMQKSWKELQAGRVFMVSSAAEPYLKGVRSSPFIRVIKLTLTRGVFPDGRFAHDQRAVDATGSKYDH